MLGVGCACGIPLVEKLRSLQVHPNATPSREKRKYWDRSALADTFGDDATERSLETTKGRGFNSPQDTSDLFDL